MFARAQGHLFWDFFGCTLPSLLTCATNTYLHVSSELRHHGLPLFFPLHGHVLQVTHGHGWLRIHAFTMNSEQSPRRSSAETGMNLAPRFHSIWSRHTTDEGEASDLHVAQVTAGSHSRRLIHLHEISHCIDDC